MNIPRTETERSDHGLMGTNTEPVNLEVVSWLRAACRTGEARRIRLEAGLTCSELARPLGCTARAVALLERGQRQARTDLASRYGELLRSLHRGCGCTS